MDKRSNHHNLNYCAYCGAAFMQFPYHKQYDHCETSLQCERCRNWTMFTCYKNKPSKINENYWYSSRKYNASDNEL